MKKALKTRVKETVEATDKPDGQSSGSLTPSLLCLNKPDGLSYPSQPDDDVPIVQTLALSGVRLELLATVAAQPSPSPKLRRSQVKKATWVYETVAEPTGVSSKYWDVEAPQERATKRRAKEKLSALHEPDGASSGMKPLAFH